MNELIVAVPVAVPNCGFECFLNPHLQNTQDKSHLQAVFQAGSVQDLRNLSKCSLIIMNKFRDK